jgi:ABC-type cobalt transport system substrate-binding protein
MPAWLTWFVAMGVLVLESALLSVFGIDGWALQTAVALTIFLALRRDFVSGALILAALLVPIEWLVVGPFGYYSLSLVVVFFVLQLARGNIQSEWGLSQAVLAIFTVALQTAIMALALLMLDPHAGLMESLLWGAVPGAIGAAVVVWPLGLVLARIDHALDPHAGRRMKVFS